MAQTFRERVYECVKLIPTGRVSTYKDIANLLGEPNSCRAVGQALKTNPFSPVVPCHRVIKSDGKVGGFQGTPNSKEKVMMLEKEGVRIIDGKVKDRSFFYVLQASFDR